MYELTDKCFRQPDMTVFANSMQQLKKRLKQNNTLLEITDHGAGSRKLGNQRKLREIYATSSSKGKYGRMLFQLMHYYSFENALELGTSLGVGTVCMATGNKDALITTIEGCPNTHQAAVENFKALEIGNIQSIQGTFFEVLPNLKDASYDLIFIDGHHDGDALVSYVEQLLPKATADTLFLLDDIRWSTSMKKAWEKLAADSRFHVSIDLFRMGILSLRPQQAKEHFVIRL